MAATVPAPQPARKVLVERSATETAELERSWAKSSMAAAKKLEAAEPEIIDEPAARPAASVKGQLEWHQLRAKRGWSTDTTSTLFYEFIQSREMFAELVTFARKRR